MDLEKIAGSILALGFAVFIGASNVCYVKSVESKGGKIMPGKIQPWLTVYDDTGDGIPNRTRAGLRGGPYGGYPLLYDREPTKEEVQWYLSN